MSEAKQDMIKPDVWAIEFIRWVAARHNIENSAAADLIITTAQTDQSKLNEMIQGFENRSTQLLFNFE